MYKFIKCYEQYLLQLVDRRFLYINDCKTPTYFICKKDMAPIKELSEFGGMPEPIVIGDYIFLTEYRQKITKIYSLENFKNIGTINNRFSVDRNSWTGNLLDPILFFYNNERSYYQITPETWEVEKIPYPDSNQYYYSSFGKYILFKNKEEQWFVYENNLDNLVWSGDYAWANSYEYNGKIEESSPELSFYGTDRIILSYNSSRTFCINLLTGQIEWENKITGKYIIAGDTAYVHPGLYYIATIDLQTGAIINKKKAVDKLSPMSRYVRKYAPAPNAGVTYHDGLLWGMADEGKEAFIGAYDPDTYQLQWSTQLPGVGEIPQQLFFLEDYLYVRCHFGNLYVYQKEKSLNLKS